MPRRRGLALFAALHDIGKVNTGWLRGAGRWALGREVLWAFAEAMNGRIEPVHAEDVLSASELADRHPGVSARDLVHAAVMQRLGVGHIISADTDFDRLEGVDRLDPARVGEWERSIPAVGKG